MAAFWHGSEGQPRMGIGAALKDKGLLKALARPCVRLIK